MSEHSVFYYPCVALGAEQSLLLKAAVLWFDKLVILDPVGASWAMVGADHHAGEGQMLHEGSRES